VDYILSLAIFSIALVLTFTLITNAQHDATAARTERYARTAAEILMSEGYPSHWQADDVVRAGILSDGVFSQRKADELANLTYPQLRSSLRVTHGIYTWITNDSDVLPLFGSCGLGNLSMNATAGTRQLRVAGLGTGAHPVLDALGITPLPIEAAVANISRFDVLVLEGAIGNGSTVDNTKFALESATARGITIFVLGNPAMPVFGITHNASMTTGITLTDDMERLGLPAGTEISASGTIDTIVAPPETGMVTRVLAAGESDQGTAIGSWLFGDAQIYYFAVTDGTLSNGSSWRGTLVDAINATITRPWPTCTGLAVPTSGNVAIRQRTLTHHEELLTLHVVTWS
jgi:hypothetical protein